MDSSNPIFKTFKKIDTMFEDNASLVLNNADKQTFEKNINKMPYRWEIENVNLLVTQ
jgi:hypothetical protein